MTATFDIYAGRMRREWAKVKTERDMIRKALGYFAAVLK